MISLAHVKEDNMKFFTKDYYMNSLQGLSDKDPSIEYNHYFETIRHQLPDHLKKGLRFHDFQIVQSYAQDSNYVLEFADQCSFREVTAIIFHEYQMIENENILDCDWLFSEIYLVDNKFEIHILAEQITHQVRLAQMIIHAKSIELIYNGKPSPCRKQVEQIINARRQK